MSNILLNLQGILAKTLDFQYAIEEMYFEWLVEDMVMWVLTNCFVAWEN